eukprot:COSAG01_NODE_63320_length_280_cov_1.132597_1_plen_63_part_01
MGGAGDRCTVRLLIDGQSVVVVSVTFVDDIGNVEHEVDAQVNEGSAMDAVETVTSDTTVRPVM